MKKYHTLILPGLLAFSLVSASPVSAKNGPNSVAPVDSLTPPPFNQEIKQERQQLRFELKDNLENIKNSFKNLRTKKDIDPETFTGTKDELKEKRNEIQKETKTAKKNLMDQFKRLRVEAIIKRLRLELTSRYELRTRLYTAIKAKVEALTDTSQKTTATAKLADYTKYQTAYEADLKKFDDLVATIAGSEKPQSLLPEIRKAANAVKKDLDELKKVLMATAAYLNQIKKPGQTSPTPTVTTAPTATPTSTAI